MLPPLTWRTAFGRRRVNCDDAPSSRVAPPSQVMSKEGNISDVYRLKYGVRTVEASPERGFLINSRPFYFAGFGKHEDAEHRGRGLDLPQLIRDMGLMGWMGGNSVRTTHCTRLRTPQTRHPLRACRPCCCRRAAGASDPYSEEFLQLCDELGIAVIAEAPAVGLQGVNMVRASRSRTLVHARRAAIRLRHGLADGIAASLSLARSLARCPRLAADTNVWFGPPPRGWRRPLTARATLPAGSRDFAHASRCDGRDDHARQKPPVRRHVVGRQRARLRGSGGRNVLQASRRTDESARSVAACHVRVLQGRREGPRCRVCRCNHDQQVPCLCAPPRAACSCTPASSSWPMRAPTIRAPAAGLGVLVAAKRVW
jgi:hypothetical protein